MRLTIAAYLILVLSATAFSQERVSSLVGTFKTFESLASKYLSTKHRIVVWLPPSYDDDKRRRFPVLYMGDGQNLFDGKLSFLPNKEWRMDESASAMIQARLCEPMIIVGIDNGGMERANEYLPTQGTLQSNKMGGQADEFVKMLVREIKPMIDKQFRTKVGPQSTGIAGSSFGGIMALYVGLSRPDVFGKVAACSPSVWWDNRDIIKRYSEITKRPKQKIWIDMGTNEGVGMVDSSDALVKTLIQKGWVLGKDVAYFVDKDAQHNEDAWARRAPLFLQFLFGNN